MKTPILAPKPTPNPGSRGISEAVSPTGPSSCAVSLPFTTGSEQPFTGPLPERAWQITPAEAPCHGCHRRPYCRCSQEELAAATRIENRVWLLLAVCGAAALLYGFWT